MSKIIETIKRIGKAWQNVLINDEEFEPLYQDRMAICNSCEYNVAQVCSIFSCPLIAKTRSRYVEQDGELSECPIWKWGDSFHETETGELVVIKANLPENLQEYFSEDYILENDWKQLLRQKND